MSEFNHCYKCHTTEELGLKSRNFRKDGTVRSATYICRACRRALHQATPKYTEFSMKNIEAWIEYANMKNERVMAKYS